MKKKIMLLTLGLLLVSCGKTSEDVVSSENVTSEAPVNSETVSSASTNEIIKMPSRKVKVYLNPSVQTWNQYCNNLGTEAEHMNNIAAYMIEELKNYDYIDLKANTNYLSLTNSVKESNTFNADIHFALHSNAGGGKGVEVLTINSKKFSNTMYEGFFKLGDFNRRGIKDGSRIYEIKNSKASDVALIEILFHDNENEAKFIVNNEKHIAQNLTNSLIDYICEYY